MAASSAVASRRAHRIAGAPRHRRVSIKLPTELLDDIEDRVGSSNVSRYLAAAVTENERRLALREWLDEMEAEHGPITEDDIEGELTRWDAEIRTTERSTGPSSSTATD